MSKYDDKCRTKIARALFFQVYTGVHIEKFTEKNIVNVLEQLK